MGLFSVDSGYGTSDTLKGHLPLERRPKGLAGVTKGNGLFETCIVCLSFRMWHWHYDMALG